MVNTKNLKTRYALISVYDKKRLSYLCKNLTKFGYSFISTGGTSKKIKELGYSSIDINKITKFKEILSGRVKSLHPKIYASLLFKRDNQKDINEINNLKVIDIDLIIVNLYPFQNIIKKSKDENKIIEMIDIGGPSLLRAASKNFKFITTISEINDYSKLIINMNKNFGKTDLNFRKKMALKTFKKTSAYDNIISNWFNIESAKNQNYLRYGENPNQKSYITNNKSINIFNKQLNGKPISYNNIIDVDSGLSCLSEFDTPTCVIIKHTNPCGVASANTIEQAFNKAYKSDSKSAFGGIVLLNKKITEKLAKKINRYFFEVIVSPNYNKKTLEILKQKKNLIILKIDNQIKIKRQFRSTIFGTLYQDKDLDKINKNFIKPITTMPISKKIYEDLLFCIKVVKHLKSNAIVLVKDQQTIGIGAGQTNRVDSLNIALKNSKENFEIKNFVCGSDGFFPFTDSVKILNKNSCIAIVKPSGSINDKKIINYCIKNKIILYFTKNRLFKH